MKERTGYFWLLGFCMVLAFTLTGCGLFGPSVEKAREVAAARQAEADAAVAAYTQAAKDLEDIVSKYEEAVKSGDQTQIEALGNAVKQAVARYESAKDVATSSKNLFDAAVQDFKDAESTSDYIGTVFGWITAGLGALFGGGAMIGRANAREAVAGVSGALEKVKNAEGDVWPAAKADMHATLSTGALKVIDKMRP